MNIDIAQLKQSAQSASPAPWITDGGLIISDPSGSDGEFIGRTVAGMTMWEDAAFIAAANPAVVLELIARLELAEAATLRQQAARVDDKALAALDRVLEAVNAPLPTDKANERAAWEAVSALQSHGETLRAAPSAPQGEGE